MCNINLMYDYRYVLFYLICVIYFISLFTLGIKKFLKYLILTL